MQKSFYDRLARPFEEQEEKKRLLIRVNRVITTAFYIVYPVLLAVLLIRQDPRVLRVFLVPLVSFVLVTLFRKACNAKRPYEVWDTPPLIAKETRGNSFPSRHVFSVFIIAMAMAYVCLPLAAVLMAVGVFLAAVRVIARVHFVKDVVAGAAIAIVLGYIGFWFL